MAMSALSCLSVACRLSDPALRTSMRALTILTILSILARKSDDRSMCGCKGVCGSETWRNWDTREAFQIWVRGREVKAAGDRGIGRINVSRGLGEAGFVAVAVAGSGSTFDNCATHQRLARVSAPWFPYTVKSLLSPQVG